MKPFFFLLLLVSSTAALGADSISVETLVAEAVANNPELRLYEAEIDAARAGQRLAGSRPDPELALEAGRKRVRDRAGLFAGEGTTWSVSVSQTFEWPGRIALRKSIANRQLELAELGLARFKAALTARARVLAYGLEAAQQKAAVATEVAARYRALREVFVQRDPAGLTPLLETRVIEAQELAVQRRAADAALAEQSARLELNQLRGVPYENALGPITGTLAFNRAPALEALLTAARENNFEFRAARLELEQQGFAVSLARHERHPSVTVSPYLTEEKAGERERTFGLGLTVPLPVGGRTGASVAAAEARRRQAEAAVLVAQRALEREVVAAAAAFSTRIEEAARWSPDAAEKFREAAALADRHFRLGAVPLATYVELQNSYLDAVEALYDTQLEALEAGLKLQQLTGLDFQAVEVKP